MQRRLVIFPSQNWNFSKTRLFFSCVLSRFLQCDVVITLVKLKSLFWTPWVLSLFWWCSVAISIVKLKYLFWTPWVLSVFWWCSVAISLTGLIFAHKKSWFWGLVSNQARGISRRVRGETAESPRISIIFFCIFCLPPGEPALMVPWGQSRPTKMGFEKLSFGESSFRTWPCNAICKYNVYIIYIYIYIIIYYS